jgi:hypothetical protein
MAATTGIKATVSATADISQQQQAASKSWDASSSRYTGIIRDGCNIRHHATALATAEIPQQQQSYPSNIRPASNSWDGSKDDTNSRHQSNSSNNSRDTQQQYQQQQRYP